MLFILIALECLCYILTKGPFNNYVTLGGGGWFSGIFVTQRDGK